MARVVAFHAGGITNEGNVLAPANTRPDQTLTLKIKGKTQMSRAMASLPWRRPWRPRTSARKETANTPSPKRDSRCNQDEGWREVWRSYGREGGGGGATQRTQGDGGGGAVLGGIAWFHGESKEGRWRGRELA